MSQNIAVYSFRGGLDTTSPALLTSPSAVIASSNYEPLAEGYGRIEGYERLDGRLPPTEAAFWSIDFKYGSSPPLHLDVVTGISSGAIGIVMSDVVVTAGDWSAHSAEGSFAITAIVGTFTAGEMLSKGGTPFAKTIDAPRYMGAPDLAVRQQRLAAAQNYYRSLIGPVPGSGPVRGVAVHQGDVFAWRDNADGTEGVMYRATASGWAAVSLGRLIAFSVGTIQINEGDVILGATSGATATVKRVVRQSGNWGTTAAGYLVIASQTASFAGEYIKIAGAVAATVTPDVAITLPAGGRYNTITHNFFGSASTYGLYGANGVGSAFEYMNGIFCPIRTGTPDDAPQIVFEVSEHLGLTYRGGSVQISAPGEPTIFEVAQGAFEIGFGTDITDVVQSNESSVAIFGEKKISILSGRDADTFSLAELTEEAGAFAHTAQRVARTIYIDNRGLRDLAATQTSAGFKAGTLSAMFDRFMRVRIDKGHAPVGSIVSRAKTQYRVFWNDGVGLSVWLGGKGVEALPFNYGSLAPYCFATGSIDVDELILAGSHDGYVYRLDRGNTHDGQPFDFYLVTPFNHFGSAAQEDRFHKVVIEMSAPNYTSIGVTAMFDYGDGEKPIARGDFFVLFGDGGLWNSVDWNDFVWSAAVEGRAEAPIDGIGRNASFIFAGTSEAQADPHVLQAYIVYRSPRKFKR